METKQSISPDSQKQYQTEALGDSLSIVPSFSEFAKWLHKYQGNKPTVDFTKTLLDCIIDNPVKTSLYLDPETFKSYYFGRRLVRRLVYENFQYLNASKAEKYFDSLFDSLTDDAKETVRQYLMDVTGKSIDKDKIAHETAQLFKVILEASASSQRRVKSIGGKSEKVGYGGNNPNENDYSKQLHNLPSNISVNLGDLLVGRYLIKSVINKGGCSIVFKAFDIRLEISVAVKVFDHHLESAHNEAFILSTEKHPCLPVIYDIFSISNNLTAIVMEFIDGIDLLSMIEQGGPLSMSEVDKIVLDLCKVVQYLHNLQPPVIHGDIKPNNILLSKKGNLYLVDYNMSQKTYCRSFPNGRTNGYSAPEFYTTEEILSQPFIGDTSVLTTPKRLVLNMASTLSEQSDIYSIGAVIYYMCTGIHPWPFDSIDADIIPASLKNVLAKCLASDASERFISVDQLIDEYLKHQHDNDPEDNQ